MSPRRRRRGELGTAVDLVVTTVAWMVAAAVTIVAAAVGVVVFTVNVTREAWRQRHAK